MAPLKRGRERVLPCRRRVTRGAEHAKAVVEALRDRRGTKCPQAPGGELERERQAVEAEADPRDVHGVLLVEREARRSRLRPLDEEPHGLVVEEPARLECLLGVGDVERRNPEHDLARHTQRLAARRQDRQLSRGAEEAVREPGSRCEHVLAVVRDEQQRARREVIDDGVDELLPGQRAHIECGSDGVRDAPRVREGGELDESRTVRIRRLHGAGELEREPRLAGTARPGEGEQSRAAKERLQLGKLAAAADERAGVRGQRGRAVGAGGAEAGEGLRQLRRQLRELVAPCRRPVVVAVLRQQLAAVDGEGRTVRGGCTGAPRSAAASSSRSTSTSAASWRTSSRNSIAPASSARRATWTA